MALQEKTLTSSTSKKNLKYCNLTSQIYSKISSTQPFTREMKEEPFNAAKYILLRPLKYINFGSKHVQIAVSSA